MTPVKTFLGELKSEAAKTRKMLQCVPLERGSWKPHEKSMTLERLTRHVAEMTGWVSFTIKTEELDFAKSYTPHPEMKSQEQLLAFFDELLTEAISVLGSTTDADLQKMWTMRNGEQIFFTLPKGVVLRDMVLNHIIHHRGQLSVYLRLLEVPIPGMYGPSADEAK